MNYDQWLAGATRQLNEFNPTENGRVDAFVLLQFVTQKSKTQIMAFGETELPSKNLQKLTALLARRLQGEPIAYIVGEKEFWSLPLSVSKDTLIPRPDTEILVERAVQIGQDLLERQETLRILDLGTGTGAIALALASELQPVARKSGRFLQIFGVDRIAEAVALARHNAKRNALDFVRFEQSDWFSALDCGEKFDMIVANPPYIDAKDEHLMRGDVRFEPVSALIADEEGYADLQFIIKNAPLFLHPQGWLLLEHGWRQGEKVRSIFAENRWRRIETLRDYGDNDRVTLAQYVG